MTSVEGTREESRKMSMRIDEMIAERSFSDIEAQRLEKRFRPIARDMGWCTRKFSQDVII